MAKQKRGQIKRLTDPAATSRQQPLGSISAPVNQNFRVRIPKPKLRPITDFSKLSATIAEGLATEGLIQGKEDEKKQRTAAKKWFTDNPAHLKNLTTLAKAVDAGILPATTHEIFWQQLQIERGKASVDSFVRNDLPALTTAYISPTREESSDDVRAGFIAKWKEKVTDPFSGVGSEFALRTVVDLRGDVQRDFLDLVTKTYNRQQADQNQTVAIGNAASGLETLFNGSIPPADWKSEWATEEFKTVADTVHGSWLGLALGQRGENPQEKSLADAAFMSIDRKLEFDPNATTDSTIKAAHEARVMANTMMGEGKLTPEAKKRGDKEKKGLVWGSPKTGYKSVFRGGNHETAMSDKIAEIDALIERLEAKQDKEKTQQKAEISDVASRFHEVFRAHSNPEIGSKFSRAFAAAQGPNSADGFDSNHEEWVAVMTEVFGESYKDWWTKDMTKSLNMYPGGSSTFLKALDEIVLRAKTTITPEADDNFRKVADGLVANRQWALLKAHITKNAGKISTSLEREFQKTLSIKSDTEAHLERAMQVQRTDQAKWVKASKEQDNSELTGEALNTFEDEEGKYEIKLGAFLDALLTDKKFAQTKWTKRALDKLVEDDPELEKIRVGLRKTYDEAIKAQRTNTAKVVNAAKSGAVTDKNKLRADIAKGLVRPDTLKVVTQIQDAGDNATRFIEQTMIPFIQNDVKQQMETMKGRGVDEPKLQSLSVDAYQTTLGEAEKQFRAFLQTRTDAGADWELRLAKKWWRENQIKIGNIAGNIFAGVTPSIAVRKTASDLTVNTGFFLSIARNENSPQNAYKRHAWIYSKEGRAADGDDQLKNYFTNAGDHSDALDGVAVVHKHLPDWNAGHDGYSLAELTAKNLATYRRDGSGYTIPDTYKWPTDPSGKPTAVGVDPHISAYRAFDLSDTKLEVFVPGQFQGDILWKQRRRQETFRTTGAWAGEKTLQMGSNALPPGFFTEILTPDLIQDRASGVPLSDSFIQAVQQGDAHLFMVPVDRFKPEQILGPTAIASGEDLDRVQPMQLGSLTKYEGKRVMEFRGVGRADTASVRTKGNGWEAFTEVATTAQFAALRNPNLSKAEQIKAYQEIQSLTALVTPMQSVMNGKHTTYQRVQVVGEITNNPNMTWSDKRRDPRWGTSANPSFSDEGKIRSGDLDVPDAVHVNLSIVTSVTVPFQKPNGEVLDWISPLHTRNFESVEAAITGLKLGTYKDAAGDNIPVYNTSTKTFDPGSLPYKYLQKNKIMVTAQSTAAFIKAQVELAAMFDPDHDREAVALEQYEAATILGASK